MPHVHHIGPKIYVHQMTYPPGGFPLCERGETQEIEHPFRTGQSVVLRMPFSRRALAVGVWRGERDEDDALMGAIAARWHEEEDDDAVE